MRLLTYNIQHGGRGREHAIAAMIRAAEPDLVLLQEARFPDQVNRIADLAGLTQFGARRGESLAFISRTPVTSARWHKPRVSRHAFLEVVPAGTSWRVFGVHLSAVHAAWTEQRRLFELRALLRAIAAHQHGPHVLAGDFNTLAPANFSIHESCRRGCGRWYGSAAAASGGGRSRRFSTRAIAMVPPGPSRRCRQHVPDVGSAHPSRLPVRAGCVSLIGWRSAG